MSEMVTAVLWRKKVTGPYKVRAHFEYLSFHPLFYTLNLLKHIGRTYQISFAQMVVVAGTASGSKNTSVRSASVLTMVETVTDVVHTAAWQAFLVGLVGS